MRKIFFKLKSLSENFKRFSSIQAHSVLNQMNTSELSNKLRNLRQKLEIQTQNADIYKNDYKEILYFIEEKEENLKILQILLFFFRECSKETSSEDFEKFLSIYHHFFKTHQKINLKSLDFQEFLLLIQMFYQYPQLLRENPDFFNFIDIYVLNFFQKSSDLEISSDFLLKLLILSMKINKGSKKLYHTLENLLNFSLISRENPSILILLINSIGKNSKFSKDFLKNIYSALILKEFGKIKPKELIETIYSSALMNFAPKELYLKSFEMIKSHVFRRNFEIIQCLWTLVYFNLRFSPEKIEESLLESLIKSLTPKEEVKNGAFQMIQVYKIHEIEVFLSIFQKEIYEKSWKYINSFEDEAFKGGIDKQESLLQNDVKIILKIAKIPFEMEKRLERIYIIDFFIPETKVFLEINGPLHYFFNEIVEEFELNGKSFVKSKLLKALGHKIVNISYRDWYGLRGVNAKINFINEKIYGKFF